MLYFLEILMNSNGPLTISQLAGRFGSRSFSPDMRTACGGNELGLKKFLLKYPSLFTVKASERIVAPISSCEALVCNRMFICFVVFSGQQCFAV